MGWGQVAALMGTPNNLLWTAVVAAIVSASVSYFFKKRETRHKLQTEYEYEQRKKLREIDDELQALERKRRELQRKHEAERDWLSEKAEQARSSYERAMRDWKG